MAASGLDRRFVDQGVVQDCMLETWIALLAALLAAVQTMVAGQTIAEVWRYNSAADYYCRLPISEVARLEHLLAEEFRWSVGGDWSPRQAYQAVALLCWQSMEGYDDPEPPLTLLPGDD